MARPPADRAGANPTAGRAADGVEHRDEQWWIRAVERWMSARLRQLCSPEDLIQGARTKLLEQGRWDCGGGYFFTVLHHFVIDRNRWAEAACRDPGRVRDLDRALDLCDGGPLERIESRDWVRTLLDALPPDARYLLRARAIDGKTWAEIAKHLGICVDTARLRYRRLTERLSIEHAVPD